MPGMPCAGMPLPDGSSSDRAAWKSRKCSRAPQGNARYPSVRMGLGRSAWETSWPRLERVEEAVVSGTEAKASILSATRNPSRVAA